VDLDLLRLSFYALKRNAAPGVDGVEWQDYEAELESNLQDLRARVHRGAYRALPGQRKYHLKPDGRQRPLGIAALEDKLLQRAAVAHITSGGSPRFAATWRRQRWRRVRSSAPIRA